MSDANWLDFSKKENRKVLWRTSRKLIYSFLLTLGVGVLFGINPFHFWDTPGHVFLILAIWIAAYHIFEAVRRQGQTSP